MEEGILIRTGTGLTHMRRREETMIETNTGEEKKIDNIKSRIIHMRRRYETATDFDRGDRRQHNKNDKTRSDTYEQKRRLTDRQR